MAVKKYLVNVKTYKGNHIQVKCFHNEEQLEKWVLMTYKSFDFTWRLL